MEIEGHHSEVELNMDRFLGEDHIMLIIIEMTLEEKILENYRTTDIKF